jgi:hypothetical protein
MQDTELYRHLLGLDPGRPLPDDPDVQIGVIANNLIAIARATTK